MKKATFTNVLSVIIAVFAVLIFGAAFLGCYIWTAYHFTVTNLVGAAFASIIPGLLCYGISSATIEFLYSDFSWKPKVKKATGNTVFRNIFTLIIAVIAILLFGGTVIYIFATAIKYLSFASILAACLASIMPALICYSATVATVEFVRDVLFKKKNKGI